MEGNMILPHQYRAPQRSLICCQTSGQQIESSSLIKFLEKERRDPCFCHLHNYVQHHTVECWALRRLVHRRINEGTLELSQQEVQRNPLLNHERKCVAAVVICADPGEDEEENPALFTAAITTLQQSSKFKNLFDQLGLMTKEEKIATQALVSIASRAGIECLLAKVIDDRALLQESSEITYRNQVKSLLAMRIWRWGTQTTRGPFTQQHP